jgi:hypothetical protein
MSDELKHVIYAKLKINRPNLTEKSLKSYTSSLFSLYKRSKYADNPSILHFEDIEEFKSLLKDKPSSSRRQYYSSLFVLTKNEKYRELMKEDLHTYGKFIAENKKSESETENWVSQPQVQEKWKEMKAVFDKVKLTQRLTQPQLTFCINFVILSLFTCIPPRRLLDYTEMKFRNFDAEKDNYFADNKLVFNIYKTAKRYGTQTEASPAILTKILVKWMKLIARNNIDTDYLLVGKTHKKLCNVQLNQRLNEVFGKQVSCNMLRHSYITAQYNSKGITLDKMKNMAEDMGHSVGVAMTYVKN